MPRTFTARFDSECGHCFGTIFEGDEVGWRDDEVVHDQCMEEDDE